MGKVVLLAGDKDVIKVLQPPAPTRPRADATYILSGGLGDLDRSIARWAARQGDRNLVFLSRSGSAGDAAQELLQELQSSGVRAAALVCNVSDEDALIKALKECEKDGFPKVAGVIQGAMQLEVRFFKKATGYTHTNIMPWGSAFASMPHASYTGLWLTGLIDCSQEAVGYSL